MSKQTKKAEHSYWADVVICFPRIDLSHAAFINYRIVPDVAIDITKQK